MTDIAKCPAGVLDGYLTIDDLAKELGVTKRTLHRWRNQMNGPARTRCGGKILYKKEHVLAWLVENEDHPAAVSHKRRRRAGVGAA